MSLSPVKFQKLLMKANHVLLKLIIKVFFFVWSTKDQILPTRLNLNKRGINTEAKCPLCEKALESTSHALLFCDRLWDVWWNWHACPISLLAENKNFVDAALQILDAGTHHDLETLFATAWSIWYNRNQVIHESPHRLPPSQIWEYAQRTQNDYKGAMIVNQLRQQPPEARWTAPPPGFYKINVDGATDGRRSLSSVGAVIRDCRGMVVAARSKVMNGMYEAETTEAIAVEEGVLLASERELNQVIIESDSLSVVHAVNTSSNIGELGSIIQGITGLLRAFGSWKMKHLKREYNKVAHELAQIAKAMSGSMTSPGVQMKPDLIQKKHYILFLIFLSL